MRKLLPTSLSTLVLLLFFLWGMSPTALGQCADPQDPYAGIISGTTAEIHWTPGGNCANPNMTTIEYGLAGFTPGTGTSIMVACPVSFPVTLTGLTQSVVYDFYIQENCGGAGTSAQIGPATFASGCSSPAQTYQVTFDGQANCATTCGSTCNISGLFSNSGAANFDWLLNSGGTPTAGTGPSEDVTYQLTGGATSGDYLYIESSNAACQFPNTAELVSSCIDVTASGGSSCHLSFYYHMFGANIGTFDLNISTNNGTSFTNIWRQNGAVGDQWRKQYVDLSAYNGQTVILQFFVSRTSAGGLGDLALDQIEFYGPVAYVYYADTDGDTYGDPNVAVTTCTPIPPVGMVADNTDCNDNDGAINPGQAEITCNGIDENCNGNGDDATVLPAPNAIGTFCITSGSNAVPSGSANSGGNLFWFDALTGGTQIANGTSPSIGPITSDTIFYLQEATSGFGLGSGSGTLLITEISTDFAGSSDMIEIQNFAGTTINYTGWRVFVSNSYSDINTANTISWNLGSMTAGQVDFRTDNGTTGPNLWGNNILWNPGSTLEGWAIIIDNNNVVRDAVFWGWSAADIAGMNATMGGVNVTGANVGWSGAGLTLNNTGGCSSSASNEAMQRSGNQDSDNDTDWTCAVYQPGAQNTGLVTTSCSSPLVPVNVFLEDADDAYHSSECSAPSNDGVECAACTPITSAGNYIANTTCSPSTGTTLNGISGCPGVDLNDNPAFMAITATQAGQMDIIVSNPGGGISTVRAALVGPISCPTTLAAISGMAAIDCDQNASALTLTHPNAQAGQVFMLIVNSLGTGPIPINLNGAIFAIELGSITATEVGNTSLVEWTTLTEENHAIFEVERSDDGQDFKKIGTVQGSGNSTSAVDYEFVDELPLSGINYYRLRSVDVDGGFSYSRVVTTYFEFEEFSATVFPNPFNNTLTLDLETDQESKAKIQLVDMTGRTVFKQNIEFSSGLNQIEIDPGQQLAVGSYLFVLNYQGKVKTFKVFKEN